jgi:hypothetical protein
MSARDHTLIGGHDLWMRLFPKASGDRQWGDFEARPPPFLIANLMKLSMMAPAERHGELIADFHADGARLSKPKVMWVSGLPAADQAGLRGDKPEMLLVAQPLGFANGEDAFIDAAGGQIGR